MSISAREIRQCPGGKCPWVNCPMSGEGGCRPVHCVVLGLVWGSLIDSLIENKHDPIKFDIQITS